MIAEEGGVARVWVGSSKHRPPVGWELVSGHADWSPDFTAHISYLDESRLSLIVLHRDNTRPPSSNGDTFCGSLRL